MANHLWNVPLDDERTMSIHQFCLAEDISENELYSLACQGRAPKLTTRYGTFYRVERISAEDRRNWHRYMANGFPDDHRDDVLTQYFLDDGEAWCERQKAEEGQDDDWGDVIEPQEAEQSEPQATSEP